jgi:hypothetical protein
LRLKEAGVISVFGRKRLRRVTQRTSELRRVEIRKNSPQSFGFAQEPDTKEGTKDTKEEGVKGDEEKASSVERGALRTSPGAL